MLVRMSEHVIKAEDTGSLLSKTFGNCLVQIKRNFDKFIQIQLAVHVGADERACNQGRGHGLAPKQDVWKLPRPDKAQL